LACPTSPPYDWDNMPLDPNATSLTEVQRQAIGALTIDAGVSISTHYEPSGGSDVDFIKKNSFVNSFHYSNTIVGLNSGNNIPSADLYAMLNPNLDAGLPVMLAIPGHRILADG
jgi:hypothetical protein